MKKILFLIFLIFLVTGCGNKYDLECTGSRTLITDVCSFVSKSSDGTEFVNKIELCGDESTGEGDYYFDFIDNKILVSFEEKYTEIFTEENYDEMYDYFSNKDECTIEKKNNRAILSCKNLDVTFEYKEYNSIVKMKDLMENNFGFHCK